MALSGILLNDKSSTNKEIKLSSDSLVSISESSDDNISSKILIG